MLTGILERISRLRARHLDNLALSAPVFRSSYDVVKRPWAATRETLGHGQSRFGISTLDKDPMDGPMMSGCNVSEDRSAVDALRIPYYQFLCLHSMTPVQGNQA